MAVKAAPRRPRRRAGSANLSGRGAVRAIAPSPPSEIDLSQGLAVRPLVLGPAASLHLCLIGLGGTGSWLAPHVVRLARVLKDTGVEVVVTFVDPDIVEPINTFRQNFCPAEVGRFKAETLAMRLGGSWGVEIRYHTRPFASNMLTASSPHSRSIVIGCVDNAAARRELAKALDGAGYWTREEGPMKLWWLDLGNARDSGQVLLGSTCRPRQLKDPFPLPDRCGALPAPSLQHPELLKPRPEELDGDVSGLSCEEMAARNVQSLVINSMMAAIGAQYLMKLLFPLAVQDSLTTFATYVDLDSLSMQSRLITEDAVQAFARTPRRRKTRSTVPAAPAY